MELFLEICSMVAILLIVISVSWVIATILTRAEGYFSGWDYRTGSLVCAIITIVVITILIIMAVIGIWHCHSNGITLIEMLRN